MAKIVLFDEIGHKGQKLELTVSEEALSNHKHSINGDWNDEVCSFYVESGEWVLYEHDHYNKYQVGYETRIYRAHDSVSNCEDAGFPNNSVSSVHRRSG